MNRVTVNGKGPYDQTETVVYIRHATACEAVYKCTLAAIGAAVVEVPEPPPPIAVTLDALMKAYAEELKAELAERDRCGYMMYIGRTVVIDMNKLWKRLGGK